MPSLQPIKVNSLHFTYSTLSDHPENTLHVCCKSVLLVAHEPVIDISIFSLYLCRLLYFGIENGADPTIETDSGYNSMDLAVALGYRSGEYFRILKFHFNKAL